MVKSEAMPVVN